MNTYGIIINDLNEIMIPASSLVDNFVAEEIIDVADYFIENRIAFENEKMIRFTGENTTYYLMAVDVPVSNDLSFSILLYTDITSAITFMRRINRTLTYLLVISGIASVLMSVLIYSRVQKAIVRLGKYAGIIGRGNFSEKIDSFEYKEFNSLAHSMNNMSQMLHTYENNQKQFFQNVSHELRTPLMSIQGYAEGIYEEIADKKMASEIIMSEGERMERMMSQLLYVSRMDSGLDTLDIAPVGLKDLLYDCIERIKILADKNEKEIIIDFPDDEIEIKTDEEKLQRAVDNIVSNCIRHTKTKIIISFNGRHIDYGRVNIPFTNILFEYNEEAARPAMIDTMKLLLSNALGNVREKYLLMAGQSGSGKSATINQVIANLLHMYSPSQLTLIMIDFKNVEFNMYTGDLLIPHAKIIAGTTDGEYALSIFDYLMAEMNSRKKQ
ncbi:MAG: FtsK/SpoIIIE domain-containing protein, partial [Defluviitaleaceae bacterium]|nr:FtsK/SpoIIIE domain-containing protein [Defluviitaleaceae bacterium]